MPAAVSIITEIEHHDLKSLPDGYVKLRRMTYGQVVQRRALTKLSLNMQGRNKDFKGELAMASKEVALFEYSHCIVEHNLEDVDGRPLNLSNEVDFDKLDPRVGQEIETLIGKMNNFEEDDQGE
jgi:hypothetical protein